MADVGEELSLGLVGFVRLDAGVLEQARLVLELPQEIVRPRHVPEGERQSGDVAAWIVRRLRRPVQDPVARRLLQVSLAGAPRVLDQRVQRRQEAAAVLDRVEPRDERGQLGADHRGRLEAEQLAGPHVGRFDTAVAAHEDDAVRRRVEDLLLPNAVALHRRIERSLLLREMRLLFERLAEIARRVLERFRFLLELADQTPRQPDHFGHPPRPSIGVPRHHRRVEAAGIDDGDLGELGADRNAAAVHPDHVQHDAEIAERSEMRERERPSRGDRCLIDDPEHRQEEEEAFLGAAHVDRQPVDPEVQREKHHAEIDVPAEVRIEEVKQVPRQRAVHGERRIEPEPRVQIDRAERELVVQQDRQ